MLVRAQRKLRSGAKAVRDGAIYRITLRNRLLLITDGRGWVLDEVSNNIRDNLPAEFKATVVPNAALRAARNCLIHFIDRTWAWSDGFLDAAHPSNRLIGLWWHGRLDDPDPGIQSSLNRAEQLLPRFTRMQVTCSSGKETMLALGMPEDMITVLPEGLDLKSFSLPKSGAERALVRGELGIPPGAIAIGSFQKDGQGWGDGMEPKLIKGPDVLADMLIRLNRQHHIHAVILGPARGYLKQRLAEAGVPYSAPGFVPGDELPRYYHALDMYVSPSRDEGGPAGVLESMASGVPVISTRAGMPPDMIEHGVDGFLADVGDARGLANCAAELITQPDLRARIAARALQTIRPYDWAQLATRYAEELYAPLSYHNKNKPR